MSLTNYDSPTFLAEKDKYMMGLSLPELLVCMVVCAMWFVMCLLLPYSTVIRMVVTVIGALVTILLIFVKLSGLNILVYLALTLVGIFSKPGYEDTPRNMLQGDPSWLDSQAVAAENRSRGRFAFLRRRKAQVKEQMHRTETQDRVHEVESEVQRQALEGAMGAEQMVRDGIRSLVKG